MGSASGHAHLDFLLYAVFPYIADPVYAAARSGRLTVEVNTEPTPLSNVVDWSLRGTAGQFVPLIADALA